MVTAPKFDQVKNIAFKALGKHLKQMKSRNPELYQVSIGDKNVLRTIIRYVRTRK